MEREILESLFWLHFLRTATQSWTSATVFAIFLSQHISFSFVVAPTVCVKWNHAVEHGFPSISSSSIILRSISWYKPLYKSGTLSCYCIKLFNQQRAESERGKENLAELQTGKRKWFPSCFGLVYISGGLGKRPLSLLRKHGQVLMCMIASVNTELNKKMCKLTFFVVVVSFKHGAQRESFVSVGCCCLLCWEGTLERCPRLDSRKYSNSFNLHSCNCVPIRELFLSTTLAHKAVLLCLFQFWQSWC